MITYPNQKVVHINKPTKYSDSYLSVGNEQWQKACLDMNYTEFKLYLYLCGNKDGFDLALSRKDVMNCLGVSKNTYLRAVEGLAEKGYIVPKKGNVYDFFECPEDEEGFDSMQGCSLQDSDVEHGSVQIQDVHVMEETASNASEEEKRSIEDLSKSELNELLDDYKMAYKHPDDEKYKYKSLYKKYNLSYGCLNKNLKSEVENRLREINQEESIAWIASNFPNMCTA